MRKAVYIDAVASKFIGYVEVEHEADFNAKANDLWESLGYDHPTLNCHNDFDLSDWEVSENEL